ncbi:MAG: hypothetical protein FJW36_07770 [Acidobacteria bacterium]|nr:hypothetical protein [Acidobacteriota bacterium]
MPINTGSILIDPRNAQGQPISGAKATFLLYNHRLRSLDSAYRLKLTGAPVLLADVPAFPNGSADIILDIDRYNNKKRFVNVQPGDATELNETFLLDAKTAKAKFPTKSHPAFAKLATPYKDLTDLQKAGLLNIHAKAASLNLTDSIESILEVRPARIFAKVNDNLLDAIRDDNSNFHEASGISHTFPKPWRRIETSGSFKTRDRQANLQLTFATNSDNQLLIDMDIDDNQGIAHAFDVIGHALTGADTHPFNIHQVLLSLQGIDPGYTLS